LRSYRSPDGEDSRRDKIARDNNAAKRMPKLFDQKQWTKEFQKNADREYVLWHERPRIHTEIFIEDIFVRLTREHPDLRRKLDTEEERAGWNRCDEEEQRKRGEREKLKALLDWSDKRLELFSAAVLRFRTHQTFENYLRVRHDFPEAEIYVGHLEGLEALFALQDDFKAQGIDPQLVAAALDANEPSIDALCLRLIELLVVRNSITKGVPGWLEKRRAAIRDETVDYLIATMLESLDWHDETYRVPGSLVVLLRECTCGRRPDLNERALQHQRRLNIAFEVAKRLVPGEKLTISKLERIANLSRASAARLLRDRKFQRYVASGRKRRDIGLVVSSKK
jgi:hypothetical protein